MAESNQRQQTNQQTKDSKKKKPLKLLKTIAGGVLDAMSLLGVLALAGMVTSNLQQTLTGATQSPQKTSLVKHRHRTR